MQSKHLIPTQVSLLSSPGHPYIHRDLSWLQFNERVLAEARSSSNPPIERLKFLGITASNLDEFFMIRFASLGRSTSATKTPSEKRHLARIRNLILERVSGLGAKQAETLEIISALLMEKGVRVVFQPAKDDPAFELGRRVFEEHVRPHLAQESALHTDGLGALENLQMACVFHGDVWFPVPRNLRQAFTAQNADGQTFIFFLDDLLTSHLGGFLGLDATPGVVRLTRDADITVDLEEDTSSIPDMVRSGLRRRERGIAVRLQYWGAVPESLLQDIVRRLNFRPAQLFPAPHTLCLHGLTSLAGEIPTDAQSKSGLSYPPLEPFFMKLFDPSLNIFDELKNRDVLFHHPYDSFDAYVKWIERASEDPLVESIQQTIYRIDASSPLIAALKSAARTKKVRVLIELRARFDELNNLRLAEELRKEGVEVGFGFGGLKLHAKMALVTRLEPDGLRRYTHLSTGNYNSSTARLYEDLAVLTADKTLGEDAGLFFDATFAGKTPTAFASLVTAPLQLHRLLLQLIRQETEAARKKLPARIVAKVNALVDNTIIDRLYEASSAGVKVDLIVRGACSLIPGVKGLSENIRVVSVVDRFLEHSRIYYFAGSKRMYLSSADWMPRNFFSRLEVAFPVKDPNIYKFIEDVVLPLYLTDTVKARELTPQGIWKKRTSPVLGFRRTSDPPLHVPAVRAQFAFADLALKRYAGTPLCRNVTATGGPRA